MASRSFKPSSLSLRPRRPSIVRTSSASSTKSLERASPLSASFTSTDIPEPVQQSGGRSLTPDSQRVGRSRPITIELPPRRRNNQVYTPTPPEPLSARGDLLGGYFPLHEENQRSYRTHPFHYEPSSANSNNPSNQHRPEPRSPLSPHGLAMTDSPQRTENHRVTATPDLVMAMPLGKYHPSNYKNVSNPAADKLAPLTTAVAPSQSHHARKKSDIKKKLQQYQRDMVEQAALAGHMPFPGAKPVSPRLLPLGSPGPVTPMELEESAGYLGAGAKVFSQTELMARMSRAEEEILRRESSASESAGSNY